MTQPTNERIQFRLIQMPCCMTLICWVNPRRPAHCPECGAHVLRHFPKFDWETRYSPAWLKVENYEKANW